ncbi:Endoplasmic reticulum membrane-associated RNA degradation protein [Frankliniella fusca]|uniref:Endoplasmic reticulum membrane-associated RNA degradation protein n=1 Tax=Frankliniella fusca TaxID=407009 RepID=A0AAE1LEY3_9NEOP|nr:Endoplasmic reticulum membrane-associated RNA degradation protein [Frankliniella fusca]
MSCGVELTNETSYLSSSIKFILGDARPNLTSTESKHFVTQRLTFDWNYILCHSDFSADIDFNENDRSIWPKLWAVFIDCGCKLQECKSTPIEFWLWTNCVEELQGCYAQLQRADSSIIPLKSALLLTSIFENALGNVYQLGNWNVPFLLKDLLASEDLLDTFGKLPMFIAKSLLGTPLAFNIRNVCWHGFPAPEEIHPDIAAALLVLITSFGEILCSSQITACPPRPRMDAVTWNSFLPSLTSTGFPNLLDYTDKVREVITTSNFIPKTHISYWIHAFNSLCLGKHGECIMLLLPALEHTLRCVFCSVNCCPHRVLVAEQHTLYTTMDEILDQFFVNSEGVQEKNELPSLFGKKVMEMLVDVLHNFEGPRLRDKLSHGECHLNQIPLVVSNHMFCVAMLVLLKLESTKNMELENALRSVEETFSPKFHSISLLKSQTRTVFKKIQTICTTFDSNNFEGVNILVTDEILKLLSTVLRFSKSLEKCSDDIEEHIHFYLKNHIETLYRTKSDMSLIGSLRKIISALEKACDNCTSTLNYRQYCLNQHVLRSRQRATFFRILEFVPSFQIVLNCILLIVMIQLHTLQEVFVK